MPLHFEYYAEKGNEFLNQVAYGANMDRKQASHLTISVFHTIRDMISVEGSLHLIAQLPTFLKGVYVEGWKPSKKLKGVNSLLDFFEAVRFKYLQSGMKNITSNKLEHAVRHVIHVMRKYIGQGELNDVMAQLHRDVAILFEPVEEQ